MRTLEQIRKDNKKSDLLLTGMEDKPMDIPSSLKEKEIGIYNDFVKPVSRRVVLKNISKTNK